ncbi:MAG TPA: TonB-dependent receptor plug domain-containing protein [bacterium]
MIRLAAVICLICTVMALAQTGASIDVRVLDAGRPVSSATVLLWPFDRAAQTDEMGKATFDGLAAGQYRLEAAAEGYAARDTSFDLSPGQRLGMPIALQRLSVTLPEVVVETQRRMGDAHVFTRKDIQAGTARTLPEFLNRSAGLDVRSDGTAGGAQIVRIGGSNADQVLVLVDGQRMRSLGSGEADLSAIPLDWVQSVKVSRGGRPDEGGEAIGGILEITTRNAGERGELSVEGEAHPTYQTLNVLKSAKTGTLSSLLSYCRTQGPGDFRYTITEDDGNGPFTVNLGKSFRRINADVARDQLLLKLSATLDGDGLLEATGYLDRAVRGMPGYLAPQLTPLARQSTTQQSVNVRMEHSIGPVRMQARGAYGHDRRGFTDPDIYSLAPYSSESSSGWEGELRGNTQAKGASLSGGTLVSRESLYSSQISAGRAARTRWAGWTQIGHTLYTSSHRELALSGDGGARWEAYGHGQALLPKVSVTLDHPGALDAGATVSWGKSYRAPSFYSLFWLDDQAAQGNPDLKSELSSEWTGSAHVEPSIVHGLRLEAEASDQRVNDLIYWKRTFDGRWKPFNLNRAHVRTLDLDLKQSAWNDCVQLSAGVNWTEARDATNDRNTGGKYLTFRAPRSYRGTLTLKLHGAEFVANCRWLSARPVLETNSKWLRAYQVADLRFSYGFRLSRMCIEPTVGANNLFDENYRIVRFAPMPGREIYAAIRVSQL